MKYKITAERLSDYGNPRTITSFETSSDEEAKNVLSNFAILDYRYIFDLLELVRIESDGKEIVVATDHEYERQYIL